jgi:hypothetical protein
VSNSINAKHSAANRRIIDLKGPPATLIPVAIILILLGCPLLGVAAIRANDIAFVSARLVDYHDQQELPVPRSAGLEELIGRQQADQVASIIRPQEPSDRPHRLLLRVEFRSSVDLRAIANRNATVFLHSYFCSHQNDFAVLSGPTVYVNGEPIRARETKIENSTGGIPGQESTYYFYLNALRKENRDSRPPQMGFDLRVTAENICFSITGSGASGLIYTSSIAVIPEAAIVTALH